MSDADQTRSELMGRIRRSDTKPELMLRRRIWAAGVRYRVDYRTPAGRADIAFPGKKVAVFLDGCFWHGCPEHYVRPRSRQEVWAKKLRGNVDRDRRQTLDLERLGWTVLRFWEHEVFIEIERIREQVVETAGGDRPVDPGNSPRWHVVAVRPCPTEDGELELRIEESLRNPERTRTRKQQRTTAKW